MVLLSDTHVPKRARSLPDALWHDIELADVVVHAGDWVDIALVDQMQARARHLIAVRGNNDGDAFTAVLPLEERFVIEELQFALVHETGPAAGRESRMERRFPDADVLVFGHSHIPWDSVAARPDGRVLRLLNPGSPTDRRRQPSCTWMTATVHGRELDVELVHRTN